MLKSISLENYKCFKEKTDIDIAPLTVLCGVNSSGKSSILKSLLMLKQSVDGNYNENSILLNGRYTLNGTFEDIVTNRKISKPIVISNSFKIKYHNFLSTFEKDSIRSISNILNIHKNDEINFYFNITIKNKAKNQNDNCIASYTISIDVFSNDKNTTHTIKLVNIKEEKFDIEIDIKTLGEKFTLSNCSCNFKGLSLSSVYVENDWKHNEREKVLNIIYSLFNFVPLQYAGIKYIAPLRNEPSRIYTISQDKNDVGLYGEFTPQTIYFNKDNNLKYLQPPQNDIFTFHKEDTTFINHLNSWCNYLGIDNIVFNENDEYKEVLKIKIGESNFVDVGFGVSQILPILTTGLLMKQNESLILQQPEIHLHPKMQMNFADFILGLAYTQKNIIIETHSDHIINRLLRRLIEDPRLINRVKFYFIDKNSEPQISSIEMNPVNGFINAPLDFFSQFGDESMKIYNASINNLEDIRLDV